jgi:transcriptional regulator with XRE-family HTH domain
MAHVAVDGQKLKQLRLTKGVTAGELSAKSGITKKCILEIESGHRQAREKTLLAICRALDLDPAAVMLSVVPVPAAPARGGNAGKKTA